eukprot:3189751-Heterocapsa_arctica.AAC.1
MRICSCFHVRLSKGDLGQATRQPESRAVQATRTAGNEALNPWKGPMRVVWRRGTTQPTHWTKSA